MMAARDAVAPVVVSVAAGSYEGVASALEACSSLASPAVLAAARRARDKLKEDGQNIAGWLQCLATFIGHVWRRYSGVDMHGLLAYILTRLRADECLDLVVLQELLARVCNVEWQEELSGDALDKLAGGRTLRSTAVVVTQGNYRGVWVARGGGGRRTSPTSSGGMSR